MDHIQPWSILQEVVEWLSSLTPFEQHLSHEFVFLKVNNIQIHNNHVSQERAYLDGHPATYDSGAPPHAHRYLQVTHFVSILADRPIQV
jgi:hypothetical protein